MSEGRELYLQVVFDENGAVAKVTNLGHAVQSVGNDSQKTSQNVDKLTESFSKSDSSIDSFVSSLKSLGIAYAALHIERMIASWVQLDIAQAQADQSLKAVMISTDRYSESFYQSTLKQAEALQKLSGIRDQDIERGQKMLMLYENIGNELMPRTTEAMVNLAALMDGDVRMAAVDLGKAMEGQAEALRRVGIVIDENVFKQRGALGVLEEIERRVNGQAQSLTEGAGKWTVLGRAIDDAKESLGRFFDEFAQRHGLLEAAIVAVGVFAQTLDEISKKNPVEEKINQLTTLYKELRNETENLKNLEEEYNSIKGKGPISALLFGSAPFNFSVKDIEESQNRIKSLHDQINILLNDLADAPTFVEKVAQATDDSTPAIKSSTEAVRDWASAWADAKPRIKEVTDQVSEFALWLTRLQWGILAKGPLATPGNDQIFNKSAMFGQPVQNSWGNLTLRNFSPTLNMEESDLYLHYQIEDLTKKNQDAYEARQKEIEARQKKEKEAADEIKRQQDEIEARWNAFVNQMGSSFTDALVGSIMGEKDAFKNLGRNILRQFLTGWVDALITKQFVNPVIDAVGGIFAQSGGAASNVASGWMGSMLQSAGKWLPALWQPMGQFYADKSGPYKGVYNSDYLGWDVGMAAGAGILGYQGGGWWGALGGAGGYAVAGPIGAAVGGVVGKWINDTLKDSEPKIPSFDLLWETINGEVKNVADTWTNMTKNDDVYTAAQQFVQSTNDYFKNLATITQDASLASLNWSFELKGLGNNINQILKQGTAQGTMQVALGTYGQLSQVFGPGFQQQFQQLFMDTLSKNLGMFTFGQDQQAFQNYMNWKFNQLTSSSLSPEQAMAAFEEFMNSQPLFSPVGRPGIQANSIFDLFQATYPNANLNSPDIFPQLEQFAQRVVPGWLNTGEIGLSSEDSQKTIQDFFTKVNEQITEILNMVTTGMGQAFADSLNTGQFETFEQGFKKSIMNSVQQGLIQSFAEENFLPIIFKPLYGSNGHPAITDILQQYANFVNGVTDQPAMDFNQATAGLNAIFSDLNTTLQGFEPMWDVLNTAFQGLSQALGLNTTAVQSNTDAILGPVNSFLASLDTGPLAPTQSMARLAGMEDQLYTAAFANPSSFSEYANFMTGSWLPQMQATSDNYADVVAGVRAQVEAMPWVAQAQGQAPTAANIGTEVAKSLAPMLLDIKDSAQITINVMVDGQVIKQQVIQALDDPAVVQKSRSRN